MNSFTKFKIELVVSAAYLLSPPPKDIIFLILKGYHHSECCLNLLICSAILGLIQDEPLKEKRTQFIVWCQLLGVYLQVTGYLTKVTKQ